MRIGIVGAGMAGLACAEALAGADGSAGVRHAVVLLDKGRGAGGRMSTRRLTTGDGEAHFDYGAQYFTVRDAAFRRRVNAWIAAGVVAPWPSAGDEAHVGVTGMNAPIRQMASGQTVRWSTRVLRIDRSESAWRLITESGSTVDVDAVVIALPAEQAADLLAPVSADLEARARSVPSEPCWTALLAFSQSLAVTTNCHRGGAVIGWAARNNSKPGRVGPESWVVQAGVDWSRRHWQAEPEWVADTLEKELSTLLELELPVSLGRAAHRWRYARSGAEGSGAIWDDALRLGICGDWLIGPRVEAAWLSGTKLASLIRGAP
jgi:predicted NAD/FAD-dependent oxidoreductase